MTNRRGAAQHHGGGVVITRSKFRTPSMRRRYLITAQRFGDAVVSHLSEDGDPAEFQNLVEPSARYDRFWEREASVEVNRIPGEEGE